MSHDTTKIFKAVILVGVFIASYTGASYAIAQTSSTNFGPLVRYDKNVIESPWGAAGNTTQIAASSCPDGSVLVGFNLLNVGSNYSVVGSLYCKTVALNFGPIVVQQKFVIENPWGGPATTDEQIQNARCSDGSVLVGFNLINMGDNYSTAGMLYCREVLSAKDVIPATGTGSTTGTVGDSPQTTTTGDYIDNSTDSGYVDGYRTRLRNTQEP